MRWTECVVLAAGGLAYGLYSRFSSMEIPGVGVWNLILAVSFGPQFISYVLFPVHLLSTIQTARAWRAPVRWLRAGTFTRSVRTAFSKIASSLTAGLLSALIGAAGSGLALPIAAVPASNSIAVILASNEIAPIAAVVAQSLLVMATLMSISLVLIVSDMILQSWAITILIAMGAFGWAATSSSGLLSGPLSLAPALDASSALRGSGPHIAAGLILLAISAFVVLAVLERHRGRRA